MEKDKLKAVFPSPEFTKRAAELRDMIAELRVQLDHSEKQLNAMTQNRGAVLAVGKDPEAEIREAQSVVKTLKQQIDRGKADLRQAFFDEHKHFASLKGQTWKALHDGFIKPLTNEMRKAAETLNAELRKVIDVSKAGATGSEQAALLDSLKEQADRWNASIGEFGMPGNLVIPDSELLRQNVAESVRRISQDNFGSNSAVAEVIKLFSIQPWTPVQPTLAERVEARRKEFQRAGEPFNP